MEDINLGARPKVAPYLTITSVDFKVTDPAAAEPNAPADMIGMNMPLQLHFTIKITGSLKNYFNNHVWTVTFYADAIGVDVPDGEVHWQADQVPTALGNDTYEFVYTVPTGLAHIAVYEFGAIAWLSSTGINAYVEGRHVEVAPNPVF